MDHFRKRLAEYIGMKRLRSASEHLLTDLENEVSSAGHLIIGQSISKTTAPDPQLQHNLSDYEVMNIDMRLNIS